MALCRDHHWHDVGKMQKGFLVEQFGQVRAHQSNALNFHLNKTIGHFDREYKNSHGPLGSDAHLRARAEYAEWLAKDLIALHSDKQGTISGITTHSSTNFRSGGYITVDSKSEFGGPEQSSSSGFDRLKEKVGQMLGFQPH